ncbi:MAG: hypothetical protein NTU58_04225 [Candidatus Nealsonbacteria bacterium]|nr:hypothetical protein [Candidatus Nealsonbacteria bacterium]
MKNKGSLYLGLTVISCVFLITLGWVYWVYGTAIGANISTVDFTASGNATTSGNFAVTGSTVLATTTIGHDGTAINTILHGTIAIDPPSIAASSTGIGTAALASATADMQCFIQAPWNLNDDLVPKGCTTTADVIGVYLYNSDQLNAAINDTSKTWGYILVK